MKIAVVENEESEISKYLQFVKTLESELKEKIEVHTFSNGFDFIENYPKELDCVFMDIDMPGINGLETSLKLREIDNDIIIIFVTNLPQFAIDGYKVQALDFLLKPLDYLNFKIEMEKVRRFTQSFSKKKALWIKNKNSNTKILFNDIKYIEIIHHDVVIHTKTDEFKFRGSLSAVEEKLDKEIFARIGSPYIVNLNFVESVQKSECILEGGISLPISRANKNNFMEILNSFLNFDIN